MKSAAGRNRMTQTREEKLTEIKMFMSRNLNSGSRTSGVQETCFDMDE